MRWIHTCVARLAVACVLVVPIREADALQALCDAAHRSSAAAAAASSCSPTAGRNMGRPPSRIRRNVVQIVPAFWAEGLQSSTLQMNGTRAHAVDIKQSTSLPHYNR